MTAIAHALVAGAIATKISNPVSAVFLGLGQHLILDSIPHWDWGTNWKKRPRWITGSLSIAETLIAITVTYFLFAGKANPVILLTTILSSLIPDWLEAPLFIFYSRNDRLIKPAKADSFIHRGLYKIYEVFHPFHSKAQYPIGLLTQVATVVFFLILLR